MSEHQQTQKSTESKSTAQKQAIPRIQAPVSHPMAIIQRARINPKSLAHADVLQLQQTIGNRAVGRLLSEIGLIPSKAKQAPPVQRQELVQRQEIPEEEPLQGEMIDTIQRQETPEEEENPLQGVFENKSEQASCPSCIQREVLEEEPLQTKRENNTGIPDNLKAGVENLSGIDMSDVRVHYNSSKPAEVGALAYTQGTNIHVAPGQEKHLPHEAWHVVQQAQGRVHATTQMKGLGINDDLSLEHEADMMGRRAVQLSALTYAQGTDIHVGQGQERHLAHEAWHVVQKTGKTKRRGEPKSKSNNVAQARFILTKNIVVNKQMLRKEGMNLGLLESFRMMEEEQKKTDVQVDSMQALKEILQERYGKDENGTNRADQTMIQKKMVDLCEDLIRRKFKDPEIVIEYFDTVDMCAGHTVSWDKDPVRTMRMWKMLQAWDGNTDMDEGFKQQVFDHMLIAMKEQLREDPQSQNEEDKAKRHRYDVLEKSLLFSQEEAGNQAPQPTDSTCEYAKGESFESMASNALRVLEQMQPGKYAIETEDHAMRITIGRYATKLLFDPAVGIVPIRTHQDAVTGLAQGARHGYEEFEIEDNNGGCPRNGKWYIHKIR